ncbi:MAG: DegT/DnrJ/EryC1/StrS family aminotransferase [Bacteroidales bacterium]|nr:DegT/DnrJ/EryC1/StrS family aminotransferase [Bacteroidales bacterium]
MQFRDLKKQYEVLKKDIDQAMIDVAASSAYIMGKPVKELEAALAEYVGVKHCVSCGNGTDALTIALKVLGVGAGDAVFVPDFTFFASAEVISLEGAHPVFVDVEEESFNICAADLEAKVQQTIAQGQYTPKAVIAVDLFGLPANYPAVKKVAERYGLKIIEDGAQGFGGTLNGKRACGFGDIGTTSFFPAKPLGCYGDGGAIFTDSDEYAALADSFRVHGKGSFKYDNVRIGVNSRLDTLQAAILQVKFRAFCDYELDAVNKAAAMYTERLSGVVDTPVVPKGYYSSWAQYTIKLKDKESRDALQSALKEAGIPSMVYYPTPMHKQTAHAPYGPYADDLCPVATSLCNRVLSLPIHPYITEEDVEMVCSIVSKVAL